MFNLVDYPEIIMHIKADAGRAFDINSAGWHGCFCPYCDDKIRKFNPSHGHFWIASTFPYGHCFRCGVKVSLYNFLVKTGFSNPTILKRLHKLSRISYSGDTSRATSFERPNIAPIEQTLFTMQKGYVDAQKNYPAEYLQYKQYITNRCLDVNPMKFLMAPQIFNNKGKVVTSVAFFNFDGQFITSRPITETKARYYKGSGRKQFYFFQDINNIDLYSEIVICEGAFDLINLYNYYPQFNTSFFIAIGDSNYKGLITNLINTFLLIGEYDIRIVFDRGIKRIDQLKHNISSSTNILNPQISIEMYEPTFSKDVSELMLLTRIE